MLALLLSGYCQCMALHSQAQRMKSKMREWSDKMWEVRQLRQLVQQRRAVRLHQVHRPAEFDLPPLWQYCSPVVTFQECVAWFTSEFCQMSRPQMKWRFPNWARRCGIPLWTDCTMYSDKVLIGIVCTWNILRSDIVWRCTVCSLLPKKCLLHVLFWGNWSKRQKHTPIIWRHSCVFLWVFPGHIFYHSSFPWLFWPCLRHFLTQAGLWQRRLSLVFYTWRLDLKIKLQILWSLIQSGSLQEDDNDNLGHAAAFAEKMQATGDYWVPPLMRNLSSQLQETACTCFALIWSHLFGIRLCQITLLHHLILANILVW